MRTGSWPAGLMTAVMLVSAGNVLAAKVKPLSVKADNKAAFEAIAAEVHRQMVPGGRFEFVTRDEYATVNNRLDDMQLLFDKYGSVVQMDARTKIQLFNDQEVVNGILTQRDDDRLICESSPPTGSLIPKTTCRKYGEIEKSRKDTRSFMERFQQVPQFSGGSLARPSGGRN
jgi:hypothetical protein